jgi:hypothetical protein
MPSLQEQSQGVQQTVSVPTQNIQQAIAIPPTTVKKHLVFVDASLVKVSSCMRRVWHTGIDGLRSGINSVDIEYGQAFHVFAKVFKDDETEAAFQHAAKAATEYFTTTPFKPSSSKKWMTTDHLKKTLFDWQQHWETHTDDLDTIRIEGAKTTELKFAIPYYADDNFEVILCGTMDSICRVRGGGAYVIKDYKTTSMWDNTGYLWGYNLDPQLKFYRFIVGEYARLYPQSIYGDMIAKGCGAVIEGIFLKSTEPAHIQRGEVKFFKGWEMAEFKAHLDKFIARLVDALRTNTIPPKEGMFNGACSTKFGMCAFAGACAAPDEIAARFILKNNFTNKPYNPLHFH